ncbi:fumarylacetoacetate hydrolase family protein [Paraphysoderma sedebokerense]|nr:fumarylacetoacetate hydrolase family protein [Paraphysoderma sedebokerense]
MVKAKQSWTHLIRFKSAEDGRIKYGEPVHKDKSLSPEMFVHPAYKMGELYAKVIEIDNTQGWADGSVSDKIEKVQKLLSPVATTPLILGIGLNYVKHAKETSMPLPTYPIVFTKSPKSIQHPYDPIVVPKICQNDQVDYEVELVVVLKEDIKNLVFPKDKEGKKNLLAQVVAGYTLGNDVSARKWQGKNLGGSQWVFAKSFDTFSPIGPMIVSPSVIPDPNQIRLKTNISGVEKQNESTSDMIFNVAQILEFVSQGTTVPAETLIFTGTPSGVGLGSKPPVYLKNGDVCDLWMEHVGLLKNEVVYE